MKWSWYTRALLALASGLTLALAFPNYNLSLLAWISVTLLVLASVGARPVVAPAYGMLSALVFFPMSRTWIDVVMRQYGDVGFWTSAGILALIGIAGGCLRRFQLGRGFCFAAEPALLRAHSLRSCGSPSGGFLRANARSSRSHGT